jgi:alkylation response protein AidB-like acyl-CoA dehydrogenase
MDFGFTQAEEGFRQEIRHFLERELPPGWKGPMWFEGLYERDDLWAVAREMARKLGERGWLSLAWPREYGGQARSTVEQTIFADEMAYYRAPGLDIFGVKMLSPVLIAFGTPEQKARHLPPIARGEMAWCQGFSEPDAGSDLASLKTRSEETDDGFVVNGQKVWTTGAHRADWIFFLARTDPAAPKHQGISFLLADMKTPGIEVRPLINILGSHSFNEVFFDNVRVPRENLVGGENRGWEVATALLNFERSGIHYIGASRRVVEELASYAQEMGLAPNPLVRHRLAELGVRVEVGRWLCYRVAWMQDRGQNVDAQASISKTFSTELMQFISNAGMQLLGLYGQLEAGSKGVRLEGHIEDWYLSNLGRTIAAGASEIQRNIIAMRGLGLPRG